MFADCLDSVIDEIHTHTVFVIFFLSCQAYKIENTCTVNKKLLSKFMSLNIKQNITENSDRDCFRFLIVLVLYAFKVSVIKHAMENHLSAIFKSSRPMNVHQIKYIQFVCSE